MKVMVGPINNDFNLSGRDIWNRPGLYHQRFEAEDNFILIVGGGVFDGPIQRLYCAAGAAPIPLPKDWADSNKPQLRLSNKAITIMN